MLHPARKSPILAADYFPHLYRWEDWLCPSGLCLLSPLYLSYSFVGYSPKCHVKIYLKSFCISWIILKSFPLPQQAEFLRLSLGFKCDLFTLDKRVKLEERSRDLAEENLRKEITNALKLLEVSVG